MCLRASRHRTRLLESPQDAKEFECFLEAGVTLGRRAEPPRANVAALESGTWELRVVTG
jgi:hypothetical protein